MPNNVRNGPQAFANSQSLIDRGRNLRDIIEPAVGKLWVPASLALILAVAAAVRLYDIGANPPGFYADEASAGYNAYSVLHTGKDEHGHIALFFEAFGEFKLPVPIYSIVPAIFVLGLTEEAVRLTTAFYGVATVLMLYLVVRELFRHQPTALAAAAVLAVLPWHVHYSRTGFGGITEHLLFILLGLYWFLIGTRKQEYWPLSGLAFFIALFTYRASWVVVPLLLAAVAVLYHREIRANWPYAAAGSAPLVLGATVILVHLLSSANDRATDQWILSLDLGPVDTVLRLLRHYFSHFDPRFLFDEDRENLRHVIPGAGWLYLWQTPYVIVGLGALVAGWRRENFVALALLLIFPVAAAVTVGSPDTSRTTLGTIAFSIMTAVGFVTAIRFLLQYDWSPANHLTGPALATALVLTTAGVGTFQFASFLDVYHGSYKDTASGHDGWQWGARQIVERFRDIEDEYDLLVMDGHSAFQEPEIFLKFYAPEDCLNCVVGRFTEDHWPLDFDPAERQLFAIQPPRLESEVPYRIKSTLYYPNDEVAFFFAEISPDGGN